MGLTTLLLFLTHGAIFLALKTTDEVRARARSVALRTGGAAVVVMAMTLAWEQSIRGTGLSAVAAGLAVVALVGAWLLTRRGRDGWAFLGSAASTLLLVVGWFAALHPAVMPSTSDPAGTLTLVNAASGHYTLVVMSWVALALVPFVVAYQAWSYWVFRRRISTMQIPLSPTRPAPVEKVTTG